jgi:hypothetical protein
MLKPWFAAAAAAITLTGFSAVAASASTQSSTIFAQTRMLHRPDSGGNGNWAIDNLARSASLTSLGRVTPANCGNVSGPCYGYEATLQDKGAFTPIQDAFTPNQGAPYTGEIITTTASGRISGQATFSEFYSSSLPSSSNVPTTVYGSGDSTSTWPELFFPSGATFQGLIIGPWTWTYRVGMQQWIDSSTNSSGQVPAAGNIS